MSTEEITEKKGKASQKLANIEADEARLKNALTLQRNPAPSVASMMQAVIDKGVTADNVVALEKLCDLYERMKAKDAEQTFNAAFNRLQQDMPRVNATEPVPNKDGSIRYRFAPFEELMEKVQPVLSANGFSVSFNSRYENERLVSVCTIRHISGHSQANEFAVRIGQGPPGATITQADGAAKTYARRGALCDALNIVVDHDDDARAIGKPVGKALGDDLEARCITLGVDMNAFLRYAGAANFESIPDNMFDRLDSMLKRKAAMQEKPEPPSEQQKNKP